MADLERRAGFPPELVAALEGIDAQFDEDAWRPPFLPAEVTPPELVEAAEDLVAAFGAVPSNWIRDGYEKELRPLIDAALDGSLTERVPVPRHKILYDSPESMLPLALIESIERFTATITFRGSRNDAAMNRLRMWRFVQKRKAVRRHGFDLELTDEEWGEL